MKRLPLTVMLGLAACSAEYHTGRGREALDRHDLSAAEAHYRKALERQPAMTAALSGLGWTYLVAGNASAAGDAFARCIEATPEEVECLRGLARVAQADGNLPRAQELLARAAAIAPGSHEVEGSFALLELAQGNVDAAEARYSALVDAHPEVLEYQVGMVEILIRKRKHEEALRRIEAALAVEGGAARLRGLLLLHRARALVGASSGRINPRDCAGTAPPVLAWLDAADASLDQARKLGISLPDLESVRRAVLRRRGGVEDRCPGLGALPAGTVLPGPEDGRKPPAEASAEAGDPDRSAEPAADGG